MTHSEPPTHDPLPTAVRPTALWVLTAALAITLAFTVTHRAVSEGRLNPGPVITQAELDAIPMQLGDWTSTGSQALDERALDMLGTTVHIGRTYSNPNTGATVSITLLVGPSGPLSAHKPEVCYGTQTFELLDNDEIISVDLPEETAAQFRLVKLRPRQPGQSELRVLYGWHNGHGWKSPGWPRVFYSGTENLLKLQTAMPASEVEGEPDASFLRELLPHLTKLANKSST